MSNEARIGALERRFAQLLAAATGAAPRVAVSDADLHALIEAARADTAAGRGYPADLARVRQDFERDAMEEGRS